MSFEQADVMRRQREAQLEAQAAREQERDRAADEAARTAYEASARALGVRPPTGEEMREQFAALDDEAAEYAVAERTIAGIDRRRAERKAEAVRLNQVDAVARASAARARSETLGAYQVRLHPLRMGGTTLADGVFAELDGGGAVSATARAVADLLGPVRPSRRAVAAALLEAGIDPEGAVL
jgi:hypothetical protein